MLDAVIGGLLQVFTWPAFGFLMLGVLVGIWLGAVPGLGGVLGLVILLPFTFGMDAVSAFALLLGMYAVTTTSDTIASVMLGIPGTAASQATILDGYPLAMKGEAARALGAAFTVSAFGGVFGALVLATSLPLILPVIMAFGSPELFMLGLLGLTMVGSLSGGSIVKGLLVALLGLMMSTVGYSQVVTIPRYWFGFDYLLDGIPLIPVVLGLFALPEIMELAIRNVSISRVPREQTSDVTLLTGMKDACRHYWLAIRCAIIGTYIGILPGLGPSISDWVAYGHAVQSARDESMFGQGDIRGVIAPEAANNAVKGGSLIPTVAFGIPGSTGTAILLGALLIQGLKPGPEMLTTELPLTFSMVWTIVIANIVVAIILMVWSRQVVKVSFFPGHLIVPGVVLFVLMGAWLSGFSIGNWVLCLAMGFIGVVMKRGGWPRPPLVLAFILGPILEQSFQISVRAYQGFGWLKNPVVIGIMVMIGLTLLLAVRGIIKAHRKPDTPAIGEGAEHSPILSWPLSVVLLLLFAGAWIESKKWPFAAKMFPMAIALPGILLAFTAALRDTIEAIRTKKASGSWQKTLVDAGKKAIFGKTFSFFGYLLSIILITCIAGQVVALILFVVLYLVRWGGYGWRVTTTYAGVGLAFLFGFYDRVLNIYWHPSLLDGVYGRVTDYLASTF